MSADELGRIKIDLLPSSHYLLLWCHAILLHNLWICHSIIHYLNVFFVASLINRNIFFSSFLQITVTGPNIRHSTVVWFSFYFSSLSAVCRWPLTAHWNWYDCGAFSACVFPNPWPELLLWSSAWIYSNNWKENQGNMFFIDVVWSREKMTSFSLCIPVWHRDHKAILLPSLRTFAKYKQMSKEYFLIWEVNTREIKHWRCK